MKILSIIGIAIIGISFLVYFILKKFNPGYYGQRRSEITMLILMLFGIGIAFIGTLELTTVTLGIGCIIIAVLLVIHYSGLLKISDLEKEEREEIKRQKDPTSDTKKAYRELRDRLKKM